MSKPLSLGALGLLSAGFMLAAPEQSQAQGFGISVNVGRGGFSYYNDPGCYYPYGGSGYSPYYGSGYSGYSGYRFSRYGDPYGYGYRPTITHPEASYYSPYSGWHSHGHIHVPTRYGYRTVPY